MTTWLTGLRTNTGRSTGREGGRGAVFKVFAHSKGNQTDQELTVDHQLGGVAVPLAHHVCPDAHVHPGVALPGVRDHQFAAAHLQNSGRDKQEITGGAADASSVLIARCVIEK